MTVLSRLWDRLSRTESDRVRRAAAKVLSSNGRSVSWWRVAVAEYHRTESGPERLFDAWTGSGRDSEWTVVGLAEDGQIEVGSFEVISWLMARWHHSGRAPSPGEQARLCGVALHVEPSQIIADQSGLGMLGPDDRQLAELPRIFEIGGLPALRFWTTYPDVSRTTAVLTDDGSVEVTIEPPGELS